MTCLLIGKLIAPLPMMKEKKTTYEIGLTIIGILFAVMICLTAGGIVVAFSPEALYFLKIFFETSVDAAPITIEHAFLQISPTPFSPMPTETLSPVLTPEPTVIPPTSTASIEGSPQGSEYEINGSFPVTASISGVYGSPQIYTLDCEAQAAVDWARFFNINISEIDFIDKIPYSDDPNVGFVGNINGGMGQLPPLDYGMHALPTANILRDEFGAPARALYGASFDVIRSEVSAGRPVIAWIVNLPFAVETTSYTPPSTGNTAQVARFEHTWIITAYNAHTVSVIDSEWTYNVRTETFLERWNALGNQLIIYEN